MIVHDGETNTFDQRWMEYMLWEKYPKFLTHVTVTTITDYTTTRTLNFFLNVFCTHGVRLIRRSLGEIAATGTINEKDELVMYVIRCL
jgi:hypothetical protein